MTLREAFNSLWATLHDISITNTADLEEVKRWAREDIEDHPHTRKYDDE